MFLNLSTPPPSNVLLAVRTLLATRDRGEELRRKVDDLVDDYVPDGEKYGMLVRMVAEGLKDVGLCEGGENKKANGVYTTPHHLH